MTEIIEKTKPAGISWLVTTLLLIGGTIYELFSKKELGLLGVIFFTSQAVYWLSYLYARNKE